MMQPERPDIEALRRRASVCPPVWPIINLCDWIAHLERAEGHGQLVGIEEQGSNCLVFLNGALISSGSTVKAQRVKTTIERAIAAAAAREREEIVSMNGCECRDHPGESACTCIIEYQKAIRARGGCS